MAILDSCPGLRVRIVVDGLYLREYNDGEEEKSPKVVTKYVEARSDVEFSLCSDFRRPLSWQYGVEVHIVIDGSTCTSYITPPKKPHLRHTFDHEAYSSQVGGKWFRHQLRFTALNIGKTVPCPERNDTMLMRL